METAPASQLLTTGYYKNGFVVDIDFELLKKQRFIESRILKLDDVDWKIRVTTMKMFDVGCSGGSTQQTTDAVQQQQQQNVETEMPNSEVPLADELQPVVNEVGANEEVYDLHAYEGYRIGLMAMASPEKDWSFVIDKFAIAIKKCDEDEDDDDGWGNVCDDQSCSDGMFGSAGIVHWTLTTIDRPVYGRAGFLNLSIAANLAYESTGKTPPHSPDCPMLLQPPALENTRNGFLDILYKEALEYSGASKRLIVQVYLQYANQLTFYSLYESRNEFQDSIGLDVRCLDCQKTFFVSLQQYMYESSFMAKNLKDRPAIDSFIVKLKIKCSSNDFKLFLQCLMPPYLRLDLIDDVSTIQNILILACHYECHTLLQRCSTFLITTKRIPLRTKFRLTIANRLDGTAIEIMRRLPVEEVEELLKSSEIINLPDRFKIILLNRYQELQASEQEKQKPCCSKSLPGNT